MREENWVRWFWHVLNTAMRNQGRPTRTWTEAGMINYEIGPYREKGLMSPNPEIWHNGFVDVKYHHPKDN